MTPEERAASICSVRIKPHDPFEWGIACTCEKVTSAIRAAAAQAHAEGRAEGLEAAARGFDGAPSPTYFSARQVAEAIRSLAAGVAGQPSGDAKGK